MSLLKSIPPFSSLHTDTLAARDNQVRIRKYPKGVVIYCEDDITSTIYIVLRGAIKTYAAHEKGKKLILRECGPGDTFGTVEILARYLRFCSAITKQDTTVAVIQEADFRLALSASPALWESLSTSLASDFAQLTWTLKNMALFDIQRRVKNVLLASTIKQNGQTIVDRRMTQQEIADRIGATRERVSFILASMKKSGILCERNRRYVLTADDVSATVTV